MAEAIDCDADSYGIPRVYCPLCSMQRVSLDDIYDYLLMKNDTSIQEIEKEIIIKYESFGEFKKILKEYKSKNKKE